MSEKNEDFIVVEHLKQYFPAGGYGKNKNMFKQLMMSPSQSKKEKHLV
ncbi:hypothetical protein EVA_12853 [gut metagenome]|uniref:Uncharacterized protein n=1 Tax=gut metagenome TaxID=749906 RepID=J9CGB0_9ZZZZ